MEGYYKDQELIPEAREFRIKATYQELQHIKQEIKAYKAVNMELERKNERIKSAIHKELNKLALDPDIIEVIKLRIMDNIK